MSKKKNKKHRKQHPQDDLFLVACKIIGIGQLMRSYKDGEMSGREETAFYGLHKILLELGEEIEEIHDAINEARL